MRRGGNCRAGVLLLLPESFDPDTPRLDLAGTALSIVAITGLVYGIIQVPIDGWADPVVLTSLAAGTVALAAFITWERRTRSPLVDLTLFGNRRFAWATAAATSVSFVMFGAFFLLPLYLHNVTGTDSLGTGLRLLPLVGGLLAGGLASERLAARSGIRIVITAGLGLLAAGLLLLALVRVDTGYGLVAAALGVAGTGLGASMAPAMDTILGELPANRVGTGTALATACRQVGSAMSVAVLGSLLTAVSTARPHDRPDEARAAFMAGMSAVMWVCAGIAVLVAVAVAVFLPERRSSVADLEPSVTMAV